MATPQPPTMIKHKPNMKKTRLITSAPAYSHDHYTKIKKKRALKYGHGPHGSAMHDTFESLDITFNQNDVSDDDNDNESSTSNIELDIIDEKAAYQTHFKTNPAAPPLFRSLSTPISDMKHFEIDQSSLTIWGNHQTELNEVYGRLTHTKASSRVVIGNPINEQNDTDELFNAYDDEFHEIADDEFIDDQMYDELDEYENYMAVVNETTHAIDEAKNDKESEAIRQYLIKEIIDTEQSYVQGLTTLLYEFIQPIFDQKMIKLKYKDIVIVNIPEILLFHTQFLQQLQTKYKEAKDKIIAGEAVIALFYKLCNKEFVDMYALYTTKYKGILNVFGEEKKNKKLQKYLKNKRKQRKPLTNHLILPIQRVTRYLLLLQELKNKTPSNHNEYNYLEQVLVKINKMVNAVNERQREIENMSQCLQVQETVIGLNRNIVEINRKLLAQFLFRKSDNQRGRQFFIFNDMIIITNIKLKCKAVIEMRMIDIKRKGNNNINDRLCFHLTSLNHQAMYETDEDKINDIDTLIELIEENRNNQYRKSLTSVGAHGLTKLLKTQSLSQSGEYREQIKLKKIDSENNLQSKANELLAKTNLPNTGTM